MNMIVHCMLFEVGNVNIEITKFQNKTKVISEGNMINTSQDS